MDFTSILNDLRAQRDRLDRAIAALQPLNGNEAAPVRKGRRRGNMSAAGRARIAAAQRARWAKVRAKQR